MSDYDAIRERYCPKTIRYLLVAESQPPAAGIASSRHFYRADYTKPDDRLFANTIRALYPEVTDLSSSELESQKEDWLRRFQKDGFYMIESLPVTLQHEVTKEQRQAAIVAELPHLVERIRSLAGPKTNLILIKSNVFVVAAQPLRNAGFHVLNTELVDYPGRFNQRAYRAKLASLVT